MDILHIATLIRVLFVLIMLGLMVIAGAVIARRRESNGHRDAPSDPSPGLQRSQRYPADFGSRKSNDAGVAAAPSQRHAA